MQILQIHNIAKLFGLSESWVYSHWREIGGFKLGGRIMFRLDKIKEYIISLEDGNAIHNEGRAKVEVSFSQERQTSPGPGVLDGSGSKGRRSQSPACTAANPHGIPFGCRGTVS